MNKLLTKKLIVSSLASALTLAPFAGTLAYAQDGNTDTTVTQPTDNTTAPVDNTDKTTQPTTQATSNLVIQYINQDTGESLKESETLTMPVGSRYTLASNPNIYGFVLVSTSIPTDGVFGQSDTELIYYYKRSVITVTVNYVDEDGVALKAPTVLSGSVGEEYLTERLTFPSLELASWEGVPEQGVFGQSGSITYTYRKSDTPQVQTGYVKLKFVDDKGNLLGTGNMSGTVGKEFTAEAKAIKGYTVTGEASYSGAFAEESQEFTFTYKKDIVKAPNVESIDKEKPKDENPSPVKPLDKPVDKPTTNNNDTLAVRPLDKSNKPTTTVVSNNNSSTTTNNTQSGRVQSTSGQSNRANSNSNQSKQEKAQNKPVKKQATAKDMPETGVEMTGSILGFALSALGLSGFVAGKKRK